jgi:hypothetical protein
VFLDRSSWFRTQFGLVSFWILAFVQFLICIVAINNHVMFEENQGFTVYARHINVRFSFALEFAMCLDNKIRKHFRNFFLNICQSYHWAILVDGIAFFDVRL